MSSVWSMILQWGSTIKMSTELPVATRHRCGMTEKILENDVKPKETTRTKKWSLSIQFIRNLTKSWSWRLVYTGCIRTHEAGWSVYTFLKKIILFNFLKTKIFFFVILCFFFLTSRKFLRIKVTSDLHLTYSKNGGNLGLVLKMKNIVCLWILLTKHVKYTYLYLFKFVLYSIVAFKAN